MLLDGVPPCAFTEKGDQAGTAFLVNAYGGSPPPVDQPELVESNVRVVEISTAGARSEESTHLRSSAMTGMAQSVHTVAPTLLNFPAGQKLQSSVFSPALYLPASHAVHLPALSLA